jgi:hypothetical protein
MTAIQNDIKISHLIHELLVGDETLGQVHGDDTTTMYFRI